MRASPTPNEDEERMSWMSYCPVVKGVAKLVNDEFYVRVDVDTNETHHYCRTFTDWLANKLADQVRQVRLSKDGAVRIETVLGSGVSLLRREYRKRPQVPWVLHLTSGLDRS